MDILTWIAVGAVVILGNIVWMLIRKGRRLPGDWILLTSFRNAGPAWRLHERSLR